MLSFNPQSYFVLSIYSTTSPLSLQEGFYGKYDLNWRSCYYVFKDFASKRGFRSRTSKGALQEARVHLHDKRSAMEIIIEQILCCRQAVYCHLFSWGEVLGAIGSHWLLLHLCVNGVSQ
jgi:hypothetical protein